MGLVDPRRGARLGLEAVKADLQPTVRSASRFAQPRSQPQRHLGAMDAGGDRPHSRGSGHATEDSGRSAGSRGSGDPAGLSLPPEVTPKGGTHASEDSESSAASRGPGHAADLALQPALVLTGGMLQKPLCVNVEMHQDGGWVDLDMKSTWCAVTVAGSSYTRVYKVLKEMFHLISKALQKEAELKHGTYDPMAELDEEPIVQSRRHRRARLRPKSVAPELLTLTAASVFLQESATAETLARFRRGLCDTPLLFRRVRLGPTRGRSLGIWTIFIAQASLLAFIESARVWLSLQSESLASTAGEVPVVTDDFETRPKKVRQKV